MRIVRKLIHETHDNGAVTIMVVYTYNPTTPATELCSFIREANEPVYSTDTWIEKVNNAFIEINEPVLTEEEIRGFFDYPVDIPDNANVINFI